MRQFSLREVLEVCESKAMEHKVAALHEQGKRDREEMIKADSMGFACIDLAETFRKMAGAHINDPATAERVDKIAREIDPQAFNGYETMIHRLRSEGKDDGTAIQTALSVYGDAIESARQKARDSDIPPEDGAPDYSRGMEDAIHWHEIRAREAELQEAREVAPARKLKYRQRADRHRLYARMMRQDFAGKVAQQGVAQEQAAQQAARQPSLPLQEDHVPLDVQRAHRRRLEVLDAE